ncbi:DUF4199 domain-containing protein [Chryseosolibacter indicus]|uniref:DUF4199 family protein n=1 Tax=Chryseosolibacter indicus TaxID=2782351 RepID=A0ABS5VP36_9BACT|nr:DUF4199 domain-containing protein [Chryseosolibacter indicus]MBT1703183.1 DUF4199 family protein [Chryseosolibacter indicus]
MKPLIRVPLINGAIAGTLGSLLVVGLYYLNRHPFLFPVYFDQRILLFGIFIFFTLKELRESYFRGILYFWQGAIASFIFIAVFAIISSTAVFLFSQLVPDFVQSYINLSMEQLKGLPADIIERIGKEVYERNLEALPSTNGKDLASLYFWQSFIIGLFISIIMSVLLRRQPKP